MKRRLAIAVPLVGLLLPISLFAQFRSGVRSFGSAPIHFAPARMTYARPAAMRIRPGVSVVRPAPPRPLRPGSRQRNYNFGALHFDYGTSPALSPGYFAGMPCLTNPMYSGSFYCSQFFPHHRSGNFGAAAFVPIYWYPSVDYGMTTEDTSTQPTPSEADNSSLADQVAVLAQQIELLREEQETRRMNPQPPEALSQPSVPERVIPEKRVSTILVYRDGHKSEVQDYAIMGQTLWVFGGQTTKKVPLSSLDLNVTQKVNEDRGVEFVAQGTI